MRLKKFAKIMAWLQKTKFSKSNHSAMNFLKKHEHGANIDLVVMLSLDWSVNRLFPLCRIHVPFKDPKKQILFSETAKRKRSKFYLEYFGLS